ncbi:MAG: hypothetical protein WC877_01145 [Dehalococcoidales bacterium]|jgi:hypothetical protein
MIEFSCDELEMISSSLKDAITGMKEWGELPEVIRAYTNLKCKVDEEINNLWKVME